MISTIFSCFFSSSKSSNFSLCERKKKVLRRIILEGVDLAKLFSLSQAHCHFLLLYNETTTKSQHFNSPIGNFFLFRFFLSFSPFFLCGSLHIRCTHCTYARVYDRQQQKNRKTSPSFNLVLLLWCFCVTFVLLSSCSP